MEWLRTPIKKMKYLKEIFKSVELEETSVIRKNRITARYYEKYRVIQNRMLETDFDREVKKFLKSK